MAGVVAVQGIELNVEIASTFTALPELIELDMPEIKTITFDRSTLDQTGLGERKQSAGRVSVSDFKATVFFKTENAAQQNVVTAALEATARTIQVVPANGDAFEQDLAGIGVKWDFKAKDGIKLMITGECDGLPAYTPD